MKALIILTLLGGCSGWSKRDVALQSAFTASLAVDWVQTQDIISDCVESNPVLVSPDCGVRVPSAFYFPAVAILHATAVHLLPSDWRPLVQGFSLGIQLSALHLNYSYGY